ncbi:hypothetical protein [Nostocoides veronense]
MPRPAVPYARGGLLGHARGGLLPYARGGLLLRPRTANNAIRCGSVFGV